MNYLSELKRRNVFKVAVAYLMLSWLILQIIDVLAPALFLPEMLMRIVFVVLAMLFPIILIITWAFELTPDGIKKTDEVDADESIRKNTGQKINYAIIGFLVLVISFQFWMNADNPDTDRENTIAVLPFSDMSVDGSQEYFGDGIAEEILNVLVSIDELDVTSRTTAFSFKGESLSVPEIAARLNVNYILEGSIRSDGNNVRVTAQLIDVATDRHLWSETYDRELTSIFAIQDEIAIAIADAMRVELVADVIGDIPTENIAAYELLLKARHMLYVPNLERSIEARAIINQALALDPTYAEGWALLSRSYDLTIFWGNNADYSDQEINDMFQMALEAANKGISVKSDHGESWSNRGHTQLHLKQWMEAKISSEQAIRLNDKLSTSWHRLGEYYSAVGATDEALAALKKATEITPDDATIVHRYGRILITNGSNELAREILDRSAEMGFGLANNSRAILNVIENDKLAVLSDMSVFSLYQDGPVDENLAHYIDAYFESSLNEEIRELLPDHSSNIVGMDFSALLLMDGEYLVQLMKNEPENIYNLITSIYMPPFRELLSQAVVKDYFIEIGLLDHWRKTKFPPFCHAVGDDDFECDVN